MNNYYLSLFGLLLIWFGFSWYLCEYARATKKYWYSKTGRNGKVDGAGLFISVLMFLGLFLVTYITVGVVGVKIGKTSYLLFTIVFMGTFLLNFFYRKRNPIDAIISKEKDSSVQLSRFDMILNVISLSMGYFLLPLLFWLIFELIKNL